MKQVILKVNDLSVNFTSEEGSIDVVNDVSFEIRSGEILGLVGESGCGKTVTSMAILNLLPRPSAKLTGEILFHNQNILAMPAEQLQALRGKKIAMIFQEPTSALNPLWNIRKQLLECFEFHGGGEKAKEEIHLLLEKVGLSDTERVLNSYPHELSGGMLQRVIIAMALLQKPELIIADEPTTALDVTVQAQIMELLVNLQKEFGTSILLITHNLNLIAQYADRLAVMYAGRIVEESAVDDFLDRPLHPYTEGLLAALPQLNSDQGMIPIPGQVPQPKDFIEGCRFLDRCSKRMEKCREKPKMITNKNGGRVACHLYS